jgi:hypothetical protein
LKHREEDHEFCVSSWVDVCFPFLWLHVEISFLHLITPTLSGIKVK